jgi:beta-lactamase class A
MNLKSVACFAEASCSAHALSHTLCFGFDDVVYPLLTVLSALALSVSLAAQPGPAATYLSLTHRTYRAAHRFVSEREAEAAYRRALELVDQALTGEAASLQQQAFLWRAALEKLTVVPTDSRLATQAAAKSSQYQTLWTALSQRIEGQQSEFLHPIAGKMGPPEDLHISVCQVSRDACRHFQGDIPPASAASLIKLPIALALMHKVATEGGDLSAPLYIDPGNYTENSQGPAIFMAREYPLGEVMLRMIADSNNIASNQLIDYLGRDYINQTLRSLGYSETLVDTKLVGDRTLPDRPGVHPNRITTRELTRMMQRIYRLTEPGTEEVLAALAAQRDSDFGYKALQEMGPAIRWVGEKTGQNSQVIGTTLAVDIGEQRYVITVAIDHSGSRVRLQQVIRDVAYYLLSNGPLDGSRAR